MDSTLLQKTAADVAYMRGSLDATLPRIEKMLAAHEEKISGLETFQTTVKVRSGVISTITGFATSLVIAFLGINKH